MECCTTTQFGYQVRNIALVLRHNTGNGIAGEEEFHNAVFNFDKHGNMSAFRLAIDEMTYKKQILGRTDKDDICRSLFIFDFIENLYTSCYQKKNDVLSAICSDGCIYLEGCKIEIMSDDLTRKEGKQLLHMVSDAFNCKEPISVAIDEIEIIRHIVNKDFFGVTFHFGYSTEHCSDYGYMFLLWDYRDEKHSQIHICTCQPDVFDGKEYHRISKD